MMNNHDTAKAAILSYLNGYGDASRAIRECYTSNDFTGIVDALTHAFGIWDKRKREGEAGKRLASLRTLLNRIGAGLKEDDDTVTVMTIESKDGKPLGIVPKKDDKKAEQGASFIAARKAVHKAISELSALQSVAGFADFHAAALNALNRMEAMPETIEYVTRSVTGVELVAKIEA